MKKTKQQIIKEEILNIIIHDYELGDKIPNETEWINKFGSNKVMIGQVLRDLKRDGYIETKRGVGTFVKDKEPEHSYSLVTNGFEYNARQVGKRASSKVLEYEILKADEKIASKLSINVGDEIIYWKRVRLMDNVPMLVEKTYMNRELFMDFTKENLNSSVYEYVDQKYTRSQSRRKIAALVATDILNELLDLDGNVGILYFEHIGYLKNGKPFEFSQSY